jgi:hypothetical protein
VKPIPEQISEIESLIKEYSVNKGKHTNLEAFYLRHLGRELEKLKQKINK